MASRADATSQWFTRNTTSSVAGYKDAVTARGSSGFSTAATTTGVTTCTAPGTCPSGLCVGGVDAGKYCGGYPTSGIQVTQTVGGTALAWITCPLSAGSIASAVTFNVWGLESPNTANSGPEVRLAVYSGGVEAAPFLSTQPGAGCVASGTNCTEFGTSAASIQWSKSPPSQVNFANGDRLVIKLFLNDAGGTMTDSNRSATISYDSQTLASQGDTWIQTTETLACQPTPTPTSTATATRTATATATNTATPTDTPTFTPNLTVPTPVPFAFFTGFGIGAIFDWTQTGVLSVNYVNGHHWLHLNPFAPPLYATHPVSGIGQVYTLHGRVLLNGWPRGTCVGGPQAGLDCDTTATYPCGVTTSSCTGINEGSLLSAMAGANRQITLSIGSDRVIRAHFGSASKQCSSTSLYRFSPCTTNADCPSDVGGNPNEAVCESSIFAKTERVALGVEHRYAVTQTADTSGARPGDVTGGLYLDGVPRGTKVRWEGSCTGSIGTTTTNGKACGADSDCTTLCANITTVFPAAPCTTGGTCSVTTVGNVTAVRSGSETVGGKIFDAYVSDVGIVPSAVDTYSRSFRVQPLWPSANSTANQWTDVNGNCPTHFNCVKDTKGGGTIDNDVGVPGSPTTVLNSSTTNEVEFWQLDDSPLNTGESILAATAWGAMREQASNGTSGKNVLIGLRDSSAGESVGPTVDLNGTLSTPVVVPGPIIATAPGGQAWSQTESDNLRGLVRFTGATAIAKRSRIWNYAAEEAIAYPAPVIPNVFPDVNGDGKKTLCVISDSLMNYAGIYDEINATATELDTVLRIALGGRKIGDVAASWQNILDGQTTGSFPAAVERGAAAKCDVAMVHIGVNDFQGVEQLANPLGFCFQRGCVGGGTPGIACKLDSDCSGGACTQHAGPQYGHACQIPSGTKSDVGTSFLSKSYCLGGVNIGQCCAGCCVLSNCDTACTGGPGVCSGGPTPNAPCALGSSTCAPGMCVSWGADGVNDMTDDTYGNWCANGSPTSPECPKGVCLHQTSTAYMASTMTAMLDAAAARTGGSAVKVVLVGNTDSGVDHPKFCIGGTNYSVDCSTDNTCTPCSVDGDCPGGICRETATRRHWYVALDMLRWFNRWLHAVALERSLPYIDLGGYWRRLSRAALDLDENLDVPAGVHPGDLGQMRMGDLIVSCAQRDTSVPENQCGDMQSTLTCPSALPTSDPATQETGDQDVLLGSPWCVTGSSTQHVDGVTGNVATAPVGAHLRCSVYTVSGLTATKVNAACDTADTLVTQPGWLTLPTTTPSACALSANSTYWPMCITDSSALGYLRTSGGSNRFASGQPYASGMPPTASLSALGSPGYALYLSTHTP